MFTNCLWIWNIYAQVQRKVEQLSLKYTDKTISQNKITVPTYWHGLLEGQQTIFLSQA